MITLKEFQKIFKDADFEEADLRDFYRSVRKTTVLLLLGKRSLTEIFQHEEKCQWPILQKIDDPDLPLYRGADKALLDAFIKSIENEKTLRKQKKQLEKVKYWSALQGIIEERAELYRSIFSFCRKDDLLCEAVAERYKRIADRKTKKRRAAWGIGIGAGAAAGAAAIWYISKKEKK
ncbi:MAG: hypothetical protein HQL08_07950 [Nitrospirae bacterium]|nr:hypothetical protein [Nitrospirota bacterium]